MVCPLVRGDNPRALALALSYVQVDKHGITISYHLHQCFLALREVFCAKDGKGAMHAFRRFQKSVPTGNRAENVCLFRCMYNDLFMQTHYLRKINGIRHEIIQCLIQWF